MPSPLQIVLNTPFWVWPLLLLVLWLGWRGLQPRGMSLRLGILPLVGLINSLVGLAMSVQPALAALGWVVALLAALPAGYLTGDRQAVRPTGGGRFEVEGGWFTMVFGLSIFAARYALGALFGWMPALKSEVLWIVVANGVGGAIAGIGLGWLMSLVLRARRLSPAGAS